MRAKPLRCVIRERLSFHSTRERKIYHCRSHPQTPWPNGSKDPQQTGSNESSSRRRRMPNHENRRRGPKVRLNPTFCVLGFQWHCRVDHPSMSKEFSILHLELENVGHSASQIELVKTQPTACKLCSSVAGFSWPGAEFFPFLCSSSFFFLFSSSLSCSRVRRRCSRPGAADLPNVMEMSPTELDHLTDAASLGAIHTKTAARRGHRTGSVSKVRREGVCGPRLSRPGRTTTTRRDMAKSSSSSCLRRPTRADWCRSARTRLWCATDASWM